MTRLGRAAREASRVIGRASTAQKNRALQAAADALDAARAELTAANELDLAAGRANGLEPALLDRLALTPARIDGMITGLRQVASLPDPVGAIRDMSYRPSGIQVGKMRTPLGVIGIIYESRPNVTIDAASLCLKSGNATILRGGSEAIHSNRAIATCIQRGLAAAGVPVIKHLDGICHVYVSQHADLDKAWRVAFNAKTYRYGICGAMETLLVDQQVAERFLPEMARRFQEKGVELRGCERTRAIIEAKPATEADWHTEYLDAILSIRVVDGLDQAIEHINHYGSHHTDSIISEHQAEARQFMAEVDSASVMLNTPTCFADGFEYGLGAEIGISTDKLHARGPVGLEGLTCEKYVVIGDGQLRGQESC